MSFCENCGKKKYKPRFCSKKCYGEFKHKNFRLISKETLNDLYIKQKLPLSTIATKLNCSIVTVIKYRKLYNFKSRDNYIDYKNTKLGHLTILEPIFPEKRIGGGKHVSWKCRCDCGNICYIQSHCFKVLKNQSCEPCSRKLRRKSKYITGVMYQSIKNSAKSRNISFDLNIDFLTKLVDIQNHKCAITGEKLVFPKTVYEYHQGIGTASLDRIDSKKGYTKDNVWWVHKTVNVIKWSLSMEEFLMWCQKITKYNKNQEVWKERAQEFLERKFK